MGMELTCKYIRQLLHKRAQDILNEINRQVDGLIPIYKKNKSFFGTAPNLWIFETVAAIATEENENGATQAGNANIEDAVHTICHEIMQVALPRRDIVYVERIYEYIFCRLPELAITASNLAKNGDREHAREPSINVLKTITQEALRIKKMYGIENCLLNGHGSRYKISIGNHMLIEWCRTISAELLERELGFYKSKFAIDLNEEPLEPQIQLVPHTDNMWRPVVEFIECLVKCVKKTGWDADETMYRVMSDLFNAEFQSTLPVVEGVKGLYKYIHKHIGLVHLAWRGDQKHVVLDPDASDVSHVGTMLHSCMNIYYKCFSEMGICLWKIFPCLESFFSRCTSQTGSAMHRVCCAAKLATTYHTRGVAMGDFDREIDDFQPKKKYHCSAMIPPLFHGEDFASSLFLAEAVGTRESDVSPIDLSIFPGSRKHYVGFSLHKHVSTDPDTTLNFIGRIVDLNMSGLHTITTAGCKIFGDEWIKHNPSMGLMHFEKCSVYDRPERLWKQDGYIMRRMEVLKKNPSYAVLKIDTLLRDDGGEHSDLKSRLPISGLVDRVLAGATHLVSSRDLFLKMAETIELIDSFSLHHFPLCSTVFFSYCRRAQMLPLLVSQRDPLKEHVIKILASKNFQKFLMFTWVALKTPLSFPFNEITRGDAARLLLFYPPEYIAAVNINKIGNISIQPSEFFAERAHLHTEYAKLFEGNQYEDDSSIETDVVNGAQEDLLDQGPEDPLTCAVRCNRSVRTLECIYGMQNHEPNLLNLMSILTKRGRCEDKLAWVAQKVMEKLCFMCQDAPQHLPDRARILLLSMGKVAEDYAKGSE